MTSLDSLENMTEERVKNYNWFIICEHHTLNSIQSSITQLPQLNYQFLLLAK